MTETATTTTQGEPRSVSEGADGTEQEHDRVLAHEAAGASEAPAAATPSESAARRRPERDLPAKRAVYLALLGLFFGVFVAFSAREGRGRRGQRPPIRPFELGLVAVATYRLARIVSFDAVTEPIRAPVAESTPGGGTEPKGRGARRALLIACPLCIGVWISAALTYGMLVLPNPTRVFATIFAAAGIAEFLNTVVTLVDSANRLVTKRRERLERESS